ncbi:MAG: aminodeoxychorismate/anthranilate synthase component II [Cytophagales bacterium]|nr:aminodeoxychorismate/anthranilate synthase component II [Cytophagales bacterium]
MKILVIDNYDSFTYNLVQIFRELGTQVSVFRNDVIPFEKINNYDKIVLSPGPGLPEDSAKLMDLVKQVHRQKPILGVCLGHQALIRGLGGDLHNLKQVCHGLSVKIRLKGSHPFFKGFPSKISVGCYHSWIATELPKGTQLLAENEEKHIMAVCHEVYPFLGVQFHPESILTPHGSDMIRNWLNESN